MKSRRLNDQGAWVVVLDKGDEAVACLTEFAKQNHVTAGRFTALGAFSDAVLGFFDFETKDYHRIEIAEQVEVASMVGDFAVQDGSVRLHPHAVLARRDGQALGGHLLSGHVHPTLEVLVTVAPEAIPRRSDPETGLALIDLDAMA